MRDRKDDGCHSHSCPLPHHHQGNFCRPLRVGEGRAANISLELNPTGPHERRVISWVGLHPPGSASLGFLFAERTRKAFPSCGLSFPIYKTGLAWTPQSALLPLVSRLGHPPKPRTALSDPWGGGGPLGPQPLQGVEDFERAWGPLWVLVHPRVPRLDPPSQS